MTNFNNIKDTIASKLSKPNDEKPVNTENKKEVVEKKPSAPKKRRRGRPSKQKKETKLNVILKKRNMTRKDLYLLIEEKYPDEPISPDAVSRIVSGNRVHYSTNTLYRICGALQITPNMALDYEEHIL